MVIEDVVVLLDAAFDVEEAEVVDVAQGAGCAGVEEKPAEK